MTADELSRLVGQDLEPSDWFLIDQDRVNHFADVTLDHSFSHVDLAAAESIGGTIVHGLLILSLIPHLTEKHTLLPEGTSIGFNYGFDRIRFITPVPVGKRVRVLPRLEAWDHIEGNRWKRVLEITVEIEGAAKPALHAHWTILYQ